MIICKRNGLKFYRFLSLSKIEFLDHAFFTRKGGYSDSPFRSLNVAFRIGDNPSTVSKNMEIVSRTVKAKSMVWAKQEHGCKITIIDKNYSNVLKSNPVTVADAMITAEPGMALMIKVADCQAIFLCDVEKKVVGNIHCGWRGNVCGIIQKTVRTFTENFGSKPQNIFAAICPALGPCCGEFKGFRTLLPRSFWRYKLGNSHFDFWELSRNQLIASGIPPHNIEISGMCTVCNEEEFFSYRGEKQTGRNAAVIMIRG